MRYKDRTDKLGGERNFQGKIENIRNIYLHWLLCFTYYYLLIIY